MLTLVSTYLTKAAKHYPFRAVSVTVFFFKQAINFSVIVCWKPQRNETDSHQCLIIMGFKYLVYSLFLVFKYIAYHTT